MNSSRRRCSYIYGSYSQGLYVNLALRFNTGHLFPSLSRELGEKSGMGFFDNNSEESF